MDAYNKSRTETILKSYVFALMILMLFILALLGLSLLVFEVFTIDVTSTDGKEPSLLVKLFFGIMVVGLLKGIWDLGSLFGSAQDFYMEKELK